MKVLVLSDSHGNIFNMIQAVEREAPRMVFHLGDCWRDGERLRDRFPELPFEQVYGNCDYFRGSREAEKLLYLEDKRVLLCHGHTYGVKQSLLAAGLAAEEKDFKSSFSSQSHSICLASSRTKEIFTTSAGPI